MRKSHDTEGRIIRVLRGVETEGRVDPGNTGESRTPTHPILQLQRTIGNQAVRQLLKSSTTETPSSPKKGWWSKHRLLTRGDRGPDVGRLQVVLTTNWGIRVARSNVFDEATVEAVRQFQLSMGLEPDGIVGPFTHAVLFESNYRFELSRPPVVQQQLSTCWAAVFESALHSWGGRVVRDVSRLITDFARFLAANNAISLAGFRRLVRDSNASGLTVPGGRFRIETVKRLLLNTNSHLILVHGLTSGSIAHCEVIFGFGVRRGQPFLSTMNPLTGGFERRDLNRLQQESREIIVVFPL